MPSYYWRLNTSVLFHHRNRDNRLHLYVYKYDCRFASKISLTPIGCGFEVHLWDRYEGCFLIIQNTDLQRF